MNTAIATTVIDEAISRSSNGVYFVKLLQNLGHSNNDIKSSMHNFLDTPTKIGEREEIMIQQAMKHLQQQY